MPEVVKTKKRNIILSKSPAETVRNIIWGYCYKRTRGWKHFDNKCRNINIPVGAFCFGSPFLYQFFFVVNNSTVMYMDYVLLSVYITGIQGTYFRTAQSCKCCKANGNQHIRIPFIGEILYNFLHIRIIWNIEILGLFGRQ